MTVSRPPADVPDGTWLWLQGFTRWIGTWCFFVGYRLRVWHRERIPRSGPIVIVANHAAMVDGPLLYGLLGRRSTFLIKQEMFHGPLSWLLPRLGQLAVRRGSGDRAPLHRALNVLRAGGAVVVFPEGTRGEGDVNTAHHGATWLARAGSATLVPVAIRGTRRPAGRSRRRFRPRVDVLVGEPFEAPSAKGRAALAAATDDMRARLAALVTELDEIRGGEQTPARSEGA
ncbi:MAG TPA: lysophospholipid acyltransferase family protein [Pseudonocardiaceae bacterium]|nr:lysophospholipid acyltransferase family protein [Pseudonocardiaceae bacterium]